MTLVWTLPYIALAVLVGGVPFGLLLGHLFADVDLRTAGSGNIGATNAWRVAGWRAGLATLTLDLLKGLGPVLLVQTALGPGPHVGAVGLAAIAAHCWTPALRFAGGKGVATSAGVLLGIAPLASVVLIALWTAIVATTRKSSLGAILTVLAAPGVFYVAAPEWLWLVAAIAGVVVLRHRSNIARIVAGTERKV